MDAVSTRGSVVPFHVENAQDREKLIQKDMCPECQGELDTGWECTDCGFDCLPEVRALTAKATA